MSHDTTLTSMTIILIAFHFLQRNFKIPVGRTHTGRNRMTGSLTVFVNSEHSKNWHKIVEFVLCGYPFFYFWRGGILHVESRETQRLWGYSLPSRRSTRRSGLPFAGRVGTVGSMYIHYDAVRPPHLTPGLPMEGRVGGFLDPPPKRVGPWNVVSGTPRACRPH